MLHIRILVAVESFLFNVGCCYNLLNVKLWPLSKAMQDSIATLSDSTAPVVEMESGSTLNEDATTTGKRMITLLIPST